MQLGTKQVPRRIELFVEDGERTPMSANVMNEIVSVINALRNMSGKNGITVTMSDSNTVIAFDQAQSNISGSTGTGGTTIYASEANIIQCNCRYA